MPAERRSSVKAGSSPAAAGRHGRPPARQHRATGNVGTPFISISRRRRRARDLQRLIEPSAEPPAPRRSSSARPTTAATRRSRVDGEQTRLPCHRAPIASAPRTPRQPPRGVSLLDRAAPLHRLSGGRCDPTTCICAPRRASRGVTAGPSHRRRGQHDRHGHEDTRRAGYASSDSRQAPGSDSRCRRPSG